MFAGIALSRRPKDGLSLFGDSDDRWRPEKLEKQLAYMREKDCALSYTSYMTCDESGKISRHCLLEKEGRPISLAV